MRQLLLFLCITISVCSIGQEQRLRAYIDTKQFYAPGAGNYLEVYFQFVGYSLKYQGVENGLQSEVTVSLNVLKNDSIIRSDAYLLQSPVMQDSIVDDFYDLRRFALEPGKYVLSVSMQDHLAQGKEIAALQPIVIEDLGKGVSFSDIEVIEYGKKGGEGSPFYRSGYYMLPRLSTFFPEQLSSLPVYFELYHTNTLKDTVCALKQTVVDVATGSELSNLTIFTKINTDEVIPVIRNVDISEVPTGKYALTYTLLSRSMEELCSQSYLFERTNDIEVAWNPDNIVLNPNFQASITDDSTSYFLESLIPISNPAEVRNIISTLKKRDKDAERKHIQAFWSQTAPTNTYDKWMQYKGQVQLVEKLYSNNFQEGFETDRGRVYLQYGAPTTIVSKETSPTEYPYEIWQYNKIGKFSNKRFVFYNPDLVNNAYRLLHSDMIGELKNPSWPLTLSKRNTNNGTVDDPNSNTMDHWGGNSNDLFRQY
ncbi:MAG: GWxTD domain-containing protein [Cryomorphaceae bacterium]|nr:GWxTD domain-containing protein [Cryomorphaceae bacterium]